MAGRTPIEMFEYTSNGKYIRKFKNQAKCREYYFPHIAGKIPILRFKKMGIKYTVLNNGNFLVKERLGRDNIRFLRRVHESEYCTDLITKNKKIVQVFNLEGKLLLEARNMNILTKMTNIPQGTINQALKANSKQVPRSEFSFKYKETEE